MKVSILKNKIIAYDVDLSEQKNCIGFFNLTEEEILKIEAGCIIKSINDDPGYLITETTTYLDNIANIGIDNKTRSLNDMTLQELLDSDEDLSGLGVKGKSLGKLISDKFFGGNIYKELQMHRIILQKVLKVIVKGETLATEDLEIISSLETMDNQAEIILDKFRS